MKLKIQPKIDMIINGESYSYKLFESLELLSQNNSQRQTGKELNISHSVLNRRIKNAEKKLGFKLVRVSKSRTYLTDTAIQLLHSYNRYQSRASENDKISIAGGHIVTSFLNSISDKLPYGVDVYSSDDASAYKLANRGIIDILALDDPQIAFKKGLDFIAIGYDYLVLVSNDILENKDIKKMEDLKNLKFVSVDGTAQRLAWNTLNEKDIPFEIKKKVKSEFDAFKIVKNSRDLYTFLNASYFKGNEVLKDETKHVISLVPINTEKTEVNKLIEYILGEGQNLIANEGFIPIKPWKIDENKLS
jgi:molybdenum-dependent DNA-binding transcriptional regulator ModE